MTDKQMNKYIVLNIYSGETYYLKSNKIYKIGIILNGEYEVKEYCGKVNA